MAIARVAGFAARAVCTSSFITRPSLPVAVTLDWSRPVSAINFLAEGASSRSLRPAGAASAAPEVGACKTALLMTAN